MTTFGHPEDVAKGIIQFNLSDFSAIRFATTQGYQDLTIGLDGLLYALPGEGLPAPVIDVFNPTTLALIRSITLSDELFIASIRGIAVAADGTIYAVGWDSGKIYQVNQSGAVLNSLNPPDLFSLIDIDIRGDNQLVVGGVGGNVILTNTSLTTLNLFTPVPGDVHVAFTLLSTPIPEPSTWLLLGSGVLGLSFVRKRWSSR
jgi:hypothetical protein